jgi:hypothetical protein
MRTRIVSLGAGVLLALALLATSTGCAAMFPEGGSSDSSTQMQRAVAPNPSGADTYGSAENAPATAGVPEQKSGVTATDRMVVLKSSMQVRVEDLAAAIASVRTLTQTVGGSVSGLTVSSNSESPATDTAASASSTARFQGPASATLTLRIPAKSLASVEAKIGKLGRLISQSADESDVTQQHIDMSARLTNLRAEEARLRALLDRAGKISELLSVERELSRVRGDIESMQAQLTYLEGQAAMATLTLSLEQPGPVVRPSGGGWGIVDAVTTGVQAAVILINGLITGIIAFSPFIAIGLLVWWLIRRSIRRRRALRAQELAQVAAQSDPAAVPATAEPEVADAEAPDDRF